MKQASIKRKKNTRTPIRASRKPADSGLPNPMQKRMREGAMIFMLAIAAFLLLSMVTYNPQDPGWTFSGGSGTVENAGGRAGAWFSDVFLQFFGYIAYIFPLMVGYVAYISYQTER